MNKWVKTFFSWPKKIVVSFPATANCVDSIDFDLVMSKFTYDLIAYENRNFVANIFKAAYPVKLLGTDCDFDFSFCVILSRADNVTFNWNVILTSWFPFVIVTPLLDTFNHCLDLSVGVFFFTRVYKFK